MLGRPGMPPLQQQPPPAQPGQLGQHPGLPGGRAPTPPGNGQPFQGLAERALAAMDPYAANQANRVPASQQACLSSPTRSRALCTQHSHILLYFLACPEATHALQPVTVGRLPMATCMLSTHNEDGA
jgi:hypothetical protein